MPSPRRAPGDATVGQRRVLGDDVDGVHAEPVDAAVEPPAHHGVERRADLGVLPVEVGLLRARRGGGSTRPSPRRAPTPGRRRSTTSSSAPRRARRPDAPAAVGATSTSRASGRPRRARLDEPGVLVGGVVDHEVHDEPHAPRVQPVDQRVEVGQGAEQRVDAAVVAHVVAVVVLRRRVHRREPHDVDPQALEVVEVLRDAREVADAVTVGVGEAARVHLVDDGPLPPRLAGRAGRGRRRGEGRRCGDGQTVRPAAGRSPVGAARAQGWSGVFVQPFSSVRRYHPLAAVVPPSTVMI